MIQDICDLILELETYLQNHATLDYVQKVEAGIYHPENLPNFARWAVVISPVYEDEKSIANRTKIETDHVKLWCIVKNFDPRLSVVGKIADIGIIKLVKDVKAALIDFNKDKKDELTVLLNELDSPIKYDTHPFPDRKDFFHEVGVPYSVKLKPIIRGEV